MFLRAEWHYPRNLISLAEFVNLPDFPAALHKFIYQQHHPSRSELPQVIDESFNGPVRVFHSATAVFYAPSDLCGSGGMCREVIRANPDHGGTPRFDTVLVSVGGRDEGMQGLLVARIQLLFSYFDLYQGKNIPCALVSWFVHPNNTPTRDPDTHMWVVTPESDDDGHQPVQVIHIDTILRGIHLLPCYGRGFIPEDFLYIDALNAFDTYFVNQFIDYHAHELLS